jgi:hypothetical protein
MIMTGKTDILAETPVLVLLRLPQIPHWLVWGEVQVTLQLTAILTSRSPWRVYDTILLSRTTAVKKWPWGVISKAERKFLCPGLTLSETYPKIQFVPHRKHLVSITETNQFMLYKKIIVVCLEIHEPNRNPLCCYKHNCYTLQHSERYYLLQT